MTPRLFFETVAEMRRAQRNYFTTRDPNILRAACKLERIIDREIERVNNIIAAHDTDTAKEGAEADIEQR